MGWQFTVWLPPLVVAGLLTLVLAVRAIRYARRYRDKTYLVGFSVAMLAITTWEFTVVVVEASTLKWVKILGYNFLNAAVVPLVLYGIFWFALAFTNNDEWVDRRAAAVVTLHVGGLSLLLALFPNLLYEGQLVRAGQPPLFGVTDDSYLALARDLKPPFLLIQAYAYVILLATAGVLVRFLFRQRDRVYWRQAITLGTGIFIPVVTNGLLFLGVTPPHSHLTELSLLLTGVLLSIAVFRYRLLDLVPIARNRVIEEMRDGFVVCNDNGEVIDYNRTASRLVEDSGGPITGERLSTVLPPVEPLLREATEPTDVEFETDVDGTGRYLHASVSRIGSVGQLITLHDITERRAYERSLEDKNEKLELLNQLVRHDIGNDVTVIDGHLSLLEPHVDDDGRVHLETVTRHIDHIQDLTSVLGDLVTATLADDVRLQPVRLDHVLETEISDVADGYPDPVIDIDGSLPSVSVSANEMLSSVFTNLLKNAVQHNDKDTPRVTVSVAVDGDTVTVSIADNGPGIPPTDRKTVFGQGERGLESSGTGIGLYLVETLVTDFGGSVHIEDNEPVGSVFVVSLQRAD